MSVVISRLARHASYFAWLFVSGKAIVNACSSMTPSGVSNKIPNPHLVLLDDPSEEAKLHDESRVIQRCFDDNKR